LKLLGDKEIYVGDENLNKIPNLLYPIIKILRDENNGNYEYSVNDNLILITGEDGEVLSYHIYNKNKFENYLFHNTKLETASSSRHDFGKIYEEKGKYFIKLNLQIRFLK